MGDIVNAGVSTAGFDVSILKVIVGLKDDIILNMVVLSGVPVSAL